MRVVAVGGQGDYYDSLMRYDEERDVQYIRNPREIPIKGWNDSKDAIELPSLRFVTRSSCVPGLFVVGFCGQLFHGIQIQVPGPKYGSPWWECIKSFYDVEAMDRHFGDKEMFDITTSHWVVSKNHPRPTVLWKDSYWRKGCEGWFVQQPNPKYTELFGQFNCPIFIYSPFPATFDSKMTSQSPYGGGYSWRLTLNPYLRLVDFMKVKDANTAWMELSTYVGGVLVQPAGKEPLPIDDKIMRDMKGFDEQSFKKGPTKEEKHNKRKKK